MKAVLRPQLILFVLYSQCHLAQVLHPVKDNIACLWGLKDDSAQWVLAPKYSLIEKNYSDFFLAMLNDKWGVLSIEGKVLIPFEYDELKTSYELNVRNTSGSPEFYASKNRKTGLINLQGNVLIPLEYDALWKAYYRDYFHIQRGKKFGLRDYTRELVSCKYTVLDLIDGLNLFVASSSDSVNSLYKKTGIINRNGDTLIPFHYKQFTFPVTTYYSNTNFNNSYHQPLNPLIVAHGEKVHGLYTIEGKCLLEPKYIVSKPWIDRNTDISYNSYNYRRDDNIYAGEPIQFLENGKYGIIIPNKGVVQPAKFESLKLFAGLGKRPPIWCVQFKGKWGLLNAEGTELLPCNYEVIEFLCGKFFATEKEGRILEYNWRDNKLEQRVYQKIFSESNSHIDLVSDSDLFYTDYYDSIIHQSTIVAHLPSNISITKNGNAIEGSGLQAEFIQVQALGYNYISNYAIPTKNGVLLCDDKYKVIIPPNLYQSYTSLRPSENIIVRTISNKLGIIDITGKLIADTIFEDIYYHTIKGLLFVKTLPTKKDPIDNKDYGNWALADSTGKLVTKPILYRPDFNIVHTYQFLNTQNGVGVFDFDRKKFITPTNFKNGFFTKGGSIIMQKQNLRFAIYSMEGKLLSSREWKDLIHLSGDSEHQFENGVGFENSDIEAVADSKETEENSYSSSDEKQIEDVWLLMNGDSLAILQHGKLHYGKRKILERNYDYFTEAFGRSSYGSYSYFYHPKHFSRDCPKLNTGDFNSYYPLYSVKITANSSSIKSLTRYNDSIAFNDSLVLRMVHQIGPKARYELYPKLEGDESDKRQDEYYNPSSYYYRIVHRDQKLISLQILDDYSYSGSSVNINYFNRSIFENYLVTKNSWKSLKLAQLFKPGFEVFLNAELVLAIQKADTLEMDCNNPASFLAQCEGRFSFSKKGLWLYLNSQDGYEFIPQLIPWQRLRAIIPPVSAAYSFVKK